MTLHDTSNSDSMNDNVPKQHKVKTYQTMLKLISGSLVGGVLPAPRRALTASAALRAAGFRKLPGLWVREDDLTAIVKFALQYADRINEIRADVRKESP